MPLLPMSIEAEAWSRAAPTEAKPSAMLDMPPPKTLPRRPPRLERRCRTMFLGGKRPALSTETVPVKGLLVAMSSFHVFLEQAGGRVKLVALVAGERHSPTVEAHSAGVCRRRPHLLVLLLDLEDAPVAHLGGVGLRARFGS
jgi:hypothetical protein